MLNSATVVHRFDDVRPVGRRHGRPMRPCQQPDGGTSNLDDMGDALEALEECWHIIDILSGSSKSVIEMAHVKYVERVGGDAEYAKERGIFGRKKGTEAKEEWKPIAGDDVGKIANAEEEEEHVTHTITTFQEFIAVLNEDNVDMLTGNFYGMCLQFIKMRKIAPSIRWTGFTWTDNGNMEIRSPRLNRITMIAEEDDDAQVS